MGDKNIGLYPDGKFYVKRKDGKDAQESGKHFNCDYFVLDMTHDQHAIPAIMAYVESARNDGFYNLADDLELKYLTPNHLVNWEKWFKSLQKEVAKLPTHQQFLFEMDSSNSDFFYDSFENDVLPQDFIRKYLLHRTLNLLERAAQMFENEAPDNTWFRDYYQLNGEHMVLTKDGWLKGDEKGSLLNAGIEILDEVNNQNERF